jgi:hypothetical protein
VLEIVRFGLCARPRDLTVVLSLGENMRVRPSRQKEQAEIE